MLEIRPVHRFLLLLASREHSKCWSTSSLSRVLQSKDPGFDRCCVRAVSKKKSSQTEANEAPSGDELVAVEGAKSSKRTPRRTRKKIPEDEAPEVENEAAPKKITKRGRKKGTRKLPLLVIL